MAQASEAHLCAGSQRNGVQVCAFGTGYDTRLCFNLAHESNQPDINQVQREARGRVIVISTTQKLLLRIEEVSETVGFSPATIYRRMKSRTNPFPAPVKVSDQAVRWRMTDVQAWVSALPTTTEIRNEGA
ncbi:MAG: AlpA family phage regulatory protein [Rhodocyclaceae bacterium]|nr:AlpA family phage regulatory protein [Rhodocyclaceae bacterium]